MRPRRPPASPRALDAPDAVTGLRRLGHELGAPRALRDLGMPEHGIAEAAEAVLAVAPGGNPAPVTPEVVSGLLRRAWEGAGP